MYRTKDVARIAQVHRDTLLRWLREGRIPEPTRDRNGWRVFSEAETQAVVGYASKVTSAETNSPLLESKTTMATFGRLQSTNWDFADSKTLYLNHGIHPYPCKFIPQIPNLLIQELSSLGETVLDPFCGSGTALVEALRLGRSAVGVDASPLAALISRVKTTVLNEEDTLALQRLREQVARSADHSVAGQYVFFASDEPARSLSELVEREEDRQWISEWFDAHVTEELRLLRSACDRVETPSARAAALVALSSIIISVSRQDSDTRYVRVQKQVPPGEAFRRFLRSLDSVVSKSLEFAGEVVTGAKCKIHECNVLERPPVGAVDLVVSSPPYPNAYSYHLYHRSRMLWLGMNPSPFKKVEIGSHRKYSSKSKTAATAETFREEFRQVLTWLGANLARDRYACFLVGDSIIQGSLVKNDELIEALAEETGFKVELNITRNLLQTKKAFNPAIGKIHTEHVLVMRNSGNGK